MVHLIPAGSIFISGFWPGHSVAGPRNHQRLFLPPTGFSILKPVVDTSIRNLTELAQLLGDLFDLLLARCDARLLLIQALQNSQLLWAGSPPHLRRRRRAKVGCAHFDVKSSSTRTGSQITSLRNPHQPSRWSALKLSFFYRFEVCSQNTKKCLACVGSERVAFNHFWMQMQG